MDSPREIWQAGSGRRLRRNRGSFEARARDAAERAFDMGVAGLLLMLLLPLLGLLMLLIKRTSRGSAVYRQARVGRYGHIFLIYKLRTMREQPGPAGPRITAGGDPRITPLGDLLRFTKLDELPQLVNVLRGEMSLVGPRPQVPEFVSAFPLEYRRSILSVRPGITGPTQLRYIREENLLSREPDPESYYMEVLLPRKCALDAQYVRRKSPVYDLALLLQTAYVFGRGLVRCFARSARRHAATLQTEAADRQAG